MASQEPESQIIHLFHEPEPLNSSSPPVPDLKDSRHAYKDHLERHSGEKVDQQNAGFQPESYGSRVEETQFQSVELESQVVDDPSVSDLHLSLQSGQEANNSMTKLTVLNQSLQLLSRPKVDDSADPAAGFTFAPAAKPSKFNLATVPAKPKDVAEQPAEGDTPRGTTKPLPPIITVAANQNVSRYPTLLTEASLPHTMMEPRMGTGGDLERKSIEESHLESALSTPVTVHEPQTPISEASNGRSAQTSSKNKSHRRIKKPFPDVAGPQSHRRWHGNFSVTNQPWMESPLSQTSTFSSILDEGNNNIRRCHLSSSVLDSASGESPKVSDRTSDSTTQEPYHFLAKGIRSADSPHRDRNSAWNLNEQEISSEAVHSHESGSKQVDPAQEARKHSGPSQFINALPTNSDSARELVAGDKAMEQAIYNSDLQEEVSDSPFNDVEGEALEEVTLVGSQGGGLNEFENRSASPISCRIPPQALSEAPSRPPSRRSNHKKSITRPVPLQDLRTQGVLESTTQLGRHSTKIKKSSNAASNPIHTEISAQRVFNGKERNKHRPTAGLFDDYKKFLSNGHEYLEIMQDYERYIQLAESQKSEIEKLRDTSDTSSKKIKVLESEKEDLAAKVQKFTELSSKYKKHMNEVVKAQKYLKIQASEIQRKASEAIQAHNAKENILQKLESAIMDAKSLRVPAEEFANLSKENKELHAENKKLVSENEKFEVHVEELRKDNVKLTLDNNKLQIDFEAATRICNLLQADVEKALIELSREKCQVELLEKAQKDAPTALEGLAELLQKIPKDVAEELSKQGGLLAKVLELGIATQAKVDEAKIVARHDRSQEAEPSAALVKLVEDLFLRFETAMQASSSDAAAQQEFNHKILGDFKKTVDQLRLDKEAEIQLNNRIFELEQTNEVLALDKNSREQEVQRFTTQIDELKQELADCRSQLSGTKDALATALAAPKEDPRLRVQIQDLETTNSSITSQLQGSNQEIAKLKEEMSSFQESMRLKDQKVQDWEQGFSEAQSTIKNLTEEKNKCLANKQQEIEKACQEARQHIAKSAEASKATLKMKLESEVSHLEQKIKEKDAELALAKEELQKTRDGIDAHGENMNKLQGELALYKEHFIQQLAQLKRLEEQNPGRETFDRLVESIRSVRNECTELRNHIESIRSDNFQRIEQAVRSQEAIEKNLRQRDNLEKKIETFKENNSELQKRPECVSEAYSQRNALYSGHGDERRSIGGPSNLNFTTPMEILPPTQQTQRLNQDFTLSSAISNGLGSHSIGTNDPALDSHGVGTPEDALRKAARGLGSYRAVSQVLQATQTFPGKVVSNLETPQIRNHKILSEGGVQFNSSHVGSSSVSQHQRQGSGLCLLRPGGRKYNKFGLGSGTDFETHHLSHTETILQGFQTAYDNSRHPDATGSRRVLGITSVSEVASNISTPSPLTDLSSMMDEVGSVLIQEEPLKGFENVRRSNKIEAPLINVNAPRIVGLQTASQCDVETLKKNEVAEASTVPRSQGVRCPPSNTEEAIRRRTAQPPKSAIKKTMLVGNDDAESTNGPKAIPTFTQPKTSARARSKDPSQIQEGCRGSYNRAVRGGKPQTPMARMPSIANESSIGAWNGKRQSPQNIPLPKRNNPKRSGSFIAQTQHAAKRVRTSKAVSCAKGDIVPDSQENM